MENFQKIEKVGEGELRVLRLVDGFSRWWS